MTNAALVDALHRAIRELVKVGEHSSIVKGVIASLQEVIDKTLEDEKNPMMRLHEALKERDGTR